jgi:hypothetical protein
MEIETSDMKSIINIVLNVTVEENSLLGKKNLP